MRVLYSFRESPTFTKRIVDLLDDDDYAALQGQLQMYPEQGNVIVGSGGLRKIRWKARGRGKRGGLRVIYYFADQHGYIYFVSVYAKNEQSGLSSQEIKGLRELVEAWLDE